MLKEEWDIFVKEDIAKPENRVNLALFHLQMNEDFHGWFCKKLGIKESSIIYPVKNLDGDRPDYKIEDNGELIGYVEIELGGENIVQLERYKKKYENEFYKVYSISGLKEHNSNLSLEEISEYLQTLIANSVRSQFVYSVN